LSETGTADTFRFMAQTRQTPLTVGEAAPWFAAPVVDGSKRYAFDSAAGRPVLMLLFGSAAVPACAAALERLQARRRLFDDQNAAFFGVSTSPKDAEEGRVRQQLPGIRFFLDHDLAVSRAFGAVPDEEGVRYRPHWLLLDRALRVVRSFPLGEDEAALDAFADLVAATPAPDWAPVVMVPNVLEPELCRTLVDLYEAHGGEDSGFMRDVGGMTRELLDPAMKVRRDCPIEDTGLARQLNLRLIHRLNPMIQCSARPASSGSSSAATRPKAAAISAPTATIPPRAPRIAASP
jgi:peroxiredoxin